MLYAGIWIVVVIRGSLKMTAVEGTRVTYPFSTLTDKGYYGMHIQ
jgi:hypothetical protein